MKKVSWILSLVVSVGCRAASDQTASVHSLVYGGDIFLGRGLNEAIWDEKQRDQVFTDAALVFKKADLALVNGEGVIASGGHLFNKGEPRPFLFRSPPIAVDALKRAGIDIVSVGNNHACDYGTDALREMTERLRKAGMGYVGGGVDLRDAKTPSYHKIGDTTVALIGGDFTIAGACRAGPKRPGVLFYNLKLKDRIEKQVVQDLSAIVKAARRHADLVFLTPHWGDNGLTAPAEDIRRLARRLIAVGFDAILGHSAHQLQGVELMGGKPVIYDAGNLLADIGGRGMIWELRFTRAGVTDLVGYPIELRRNRTGLAKDATNRQILKLVQERSRALGTAVAVKKGVAKVRCEPGQPREPTSRLPLPNRPIPKTVRPAPNDLLRASMPHDVIKTEVSYSNGITLVGYKLFTEELFVPKAAQVVELFFKTDRPIKKRCQIHLEAVRKRPGDGLQKNFERHYPGDWLMPTDQWPVGRIITDRKLFRLNFQPRGEIDFSMALRDGQLIAPASSALPVRDKAHVYLGTAAYTDTARRIYHYIHRIVTGRMRRGR